MKLDKIIIEGFRGYRERRVIDVGQLTAFVGKNDVGKSTILEALDAFFNDEVDAQDVCTSVPSKKFTIGCVFSSVPEAINLDATATTTLSNEYLLNADLKLEVYKTWKCTASKADLERIYAVALSPTNGQAQDLLFKKRDELREIVDQLGVEANRNKNPDMRAAIYAHLGVGNLGLQMREVDLDRPKDKEDGLEDAKKIWKKLNDRHLPVYTLFKSEQVRGDKELAVRSPLDATLKAALKDLEAALAPVAAQVEAAVRETTDRTLERLRKDYPDVARNLVPEYRAPSWSKAFDLDVLRGEDDVPLNKRGAGVRRLVVLAFFQAEAEKRRRGRADGLSTPPIIYAIEEPETSQHPNFQRNIIRAFESLSDSGDQVILTTHVPGIAALLPTDSVRLVARDAQGHVQVLEPGDDVFDRVTEDLGLMPDRRAQVAIFVEGPNDVEFLLRASKLHRANDDSLIDLEVDHRVAFVPTGGGNLRHWIDKKYLANLKLIEVHIYDTDDQAAPKYANQIAEVNGRGTSDVGFLTDKREMENYIHADAIAGALQCNIVVTDWCDVPDLVAEQVYIAGGGQTPWALVEEEKKRKKISQAKRRLNTDAASHMNLQQLQAMDAGGVIQQWLTAIRDRCQ